MSKDPFEDDRKAIMDAIAEECEAFYLRDYDKWAGYWAHDEDTRRLSAQAGGNIVLDNGWAEGSEMMARVMKDHPIPNQRAVDEIRREFKVIRIEGNMAWVFFDQFTPNTGDIMVNVGLSHQTRLLVRQEGRWKVLFAGHADTRAEYLRCPAIHVSDKGQIEWMNDAARQGLRQHPILTQSSGILRAGRREDDKELHKAIAEVSALTAMDTRLSPLESNEDRSVRPLVFEDPLGTVLHVIWVSSTDNFTLVTFQDEGRRDQRLAKAQDLYAFSKTQMRLGHLIVEGADLPQAAEAMGISITTARTHLRRMFDKAHVNSQTALVRVLLSASAPGQ